MGKTTVIAALLTTLGTSALAQERPVQPIAMPIAQVLALAQEPFLPRAGFHQALLTAIPEVVLEPERIDTIRVFDPYFWAMAGTFGPNRARDTPGAIFQCARYGLPTREYFAQTALTDPDAFTLMRVALPLHDDDEVWPEGAVARLHCSFVWDDERVVTILDLVPAQSALSAMFDVVAQGEGQRSLFGPEGYRLEAHGGARTTVMEVESAEILLTQGHQSVTFRSFLMGGGS